VEYKVFDKRVNKNNAIDLSSKQVQMIYHRNPQRQHDSSERGAFQMLIYSVNLLALLRCRMLKHVQEKH
jgi:hypothetical protein